MLASLFLGRWKTTQVFFWGLFHDATILNTRIPFLSNQDFIECHLPFFNAQLRVIEIRFKALCWIFAREKSCGKGGEGGCFSFFLWTLSMQRPSEREKYVEQKRWRKATVSTTNQPVVVRNFGSSQVTIQIVFLRCIQAEGWNPKNVEDDMHILHIHHSPMTTRSF